jgi:hypothetical protein
MLGNTLPNVKRPERVSIISSNKMYATLKCTVLVIGYSTKFAKIFVDAIQFL